jgi:hypothetical protein
LSVASMDDRIGCSQVVDGFIFLHYFFVINI